jgi:hypothetical protein
LFVAWTGISIPASQLHSSAEYMSPQQHTRTDNATAGQAHVRRACAKSWMAPRQHITAQGVETQWTARHPPSPLCGQHLLPSRTTNPPQWLRL